MSRNLFLDIELHLYAVAPREGRVSRNSGFDGVFIGLLVAPREGRVSRNAPVITQIATTLGRAPRGACE